MATQLQSIAMPVSVVKEQGSFTPSGMICWDRTLPARRASLASIDDENMCIGESFKAAQNVVYKSPVDVGLGPFTLTAAYKANAVDLAKKRVALAGARLANLLNAAFK